MRVLSVSSFSVCSLNVSLSRAEVLHGIALETNFIYTNLSITVSLSHKHTHFLTFRSLAEHMYRIFTNTKNKYNIFYKLTNIQKFGVSKIKK